MRKIAVFGLGRFGMRLAKELAGAGVEVIAIDKAKRLIDAVAPFVTRAVVLDVTDEETLRGQGVGEVDICVIAVGEEFETTLLATLVAKKLEIATVISRAQTDLQVEILKRVGADQIILPESEVAIHLTRKLAYPQLEDYFEIDDNHSIIQLKAPKRFQNYSLKKLQLREKYNVNLVAIKRPVPSTSEDEPPRSHFIGVPTGEDIIKENDTLVLIGRVEAIADLPQE